MTTHPDLETRLRTGLRAAGEALPPARLTRPIDVAPRRPPEEPASTCRRPGAAALAVAAAAVVAVVGVAAVTRTGDDDPADVESTPATDQSTTTTAATGGGHAGPGKDPVAGSAVVTGDELVTYGPDGKPGETVSLASLTDVQSVVPDGGWIACGSPAATATLTLPDGDGGSVWTAPAPDATTTVAVDPGPIDVADRVSEQLEEREGVGVTESTTSCSAPGRSPSRWTSAPSARPAPWA